MSKKQSRIVFESIYQLWQFAQNIKASSIEVLTAERTLICDCSAEELAQAEKYGGKVIEDPVVRTMTGR